LPDDAFYLVAMFGCLAAGRPCLLLNRDNPPDYNRDLIKASGLQGLLVTAADVRDAAASDGPRLVPIEPALMTGGDRDRQPAGRIGPDEPAFILSTSGSTGGPKLIARSQRNFQVHARGIIQACHYSENDRTFMLGAPATGAAVSLRFVSLLAGATLHIVDVPRAGIGGVLRVLRDQRITSMRGTASLIKALSQLDDPRPYLASLRMMWGGGEAMLQKDLERIRALLPPGCLFGYSFNMTEASVARWFVPERDDHDPARVAAGYLLPYVDVLVLDDEGRPCPMGEIGELVIRSENVALGDWVGGQLVADRFPSDPTDPRKRIYRTGDLVRIHPDGVMVVHGRKDRMIKIRGQRVEPAVVEAEIRAVPGVADAAVVVKRTDNDVRLLGFVAPHPSVGDGLIAAIHDALASALPPYMRPSEIRLVDALPVNVGGKVDLKLLLESVHSGEGAPEPASMTG
jgi:acyl-coenzyme A synthetase/AMP-(fatty) acid ligase